MKRDYFYTWTAQDNAFHFDIEGCKQHSFLSQGKEIIDLTSLSYQAGFGYQCQEITSKIKSQLDTLPMTSAKADFELKTRVSQKLLSSLGLNGKIFYTTSGAESVENALKIAREQRKTTTICSRNVSYHGATLASLSVTGDWRNQAHETLDSWTLRIPEPKDDPDGKQTREIIETHGPEMVAAIILETVTGGNGVWSGSESYWREIQSICDDHGIFLILDEIICGFHRIGPLFGFQQFDFLKPNLITLSKQITGGYIPFGAVFVGEKLAEYYDKNVLACGLTNYAHPLGLAALDGVFDLIESDDFQKQFNQNLKAFSDFCSRIEKKKNVKELRIQGLLAAIEVDFTPIASEFFDKGVYLLTGPDRIMLSPALNMNTTLLEKGLKVVEDYLTEKS